MNDKELKKLSKEQLISLVKHEREHFNEAIDRLMDTLIQTESKLEETEKELKKARKRAEDWEHLWLRENAKKLRENAKKLRERIEKIASVFIRFFYNPKEGRLLRMRCRYIRRWYVGILHAMWQCGV